MFKKIQKFFQRFNKKQHIIQNNEWNSEYNE